MLFLNIKSSVEQTDNGAVTNHIQGNVPDGDVSPDNPLMRALSPEEQALLQILWEYFVRSSADVNDLGWPFWFYVEKTFSRQYPNGPEAKDVLESLPSIPRPPDAQPAAAYSLLWYQNQAVQEPTATDPVGLTIAGMAQLGKTNRVSADAANVLVGVMRSLAEYEDHQEPQPHVVTNSQVNLAEYLSWFSKATREKPFVVSGRLISELLSREFVRVNAYWSGCQATTSLYGASLKDLLTVTDTSDYLDLAAARSLAAELPRWHDSALPLVQTLDYLTYVLAADPAFGRRLIESPDLQSATSLAATANSAAEFESHLNGIWNLIDGFQVPECSEEVLKARFGGDTAKGSLNYLDCWLKANLDVDGFERVQRALQVIRSVRKIRVSHAHSRHETRAAAIKAQRQLGLPDMIHDWGAAFELVKARLAGAFDVVRQETQSRPRSNSK